MHSAAPRRPGPLLILPAHLRERLAPVIYIAERPRPRMAHALKSVTPTVSRGLVCAAEDPFGDALDEGLEGGEAGAGDADIEIRWKSI